MKVILLDEVKGQGGEGDVIEVATGFANNYLFPRKLAIAATSGNLKQLEQRKHNIEKRELARTTDAQKILEALDGKTVTIPAKVGEEGQLFGSITTAMIADAVAEQIGAQVDRKKVDLRNAIKTAGEHQVSISIYRDIHAMLNIKVVDENAKEEEAEVVEAAEGAEDAVAGTDEIVEGEVAADAEAPAEAPAE